MKQPQQLDKHEPDYKANAWEGFTLAELGNWVHNFTLRAGMRNNRAKAEKDLTDAENYHAIMGAYIAHEKEKILAGLQ